ncbi:sulfate adenylyltransferase subunit CysD [Ferrovum sp.]|uniref:sulfate adenylyltransferase subunit CysD n=1 Tax=Ferrovum sp. TaxID=2609467 RepID=UPI0026101177|nr:sulfate adenylyltransferase subunit CysD [Ferrovum sp.]
MTPTLLFEPAPSRLWSTEMMIDRLDHLGLASRLTDSPLEAWGLLPAPLTPDTLRDESGRKLNILILDHELKVAGTEGITLLFAQAGQGADNKNYIFFNDPENKRWWFPLPGPGRPEDLAPMLEELKTHLNGPFMVFPHGSLVSLCRQGTMASEWNLLPYPPVLNLDSQSRTPRSPHRVNPHLQRLEAESIHIIREAVAEADNPVMLYSIGKDSGVMLHLARKAFYPAQPPFPLLHVDTRWKFQEMYLFRDYMARESGMKLWVYTHPEAIEKNINPFDHGSSMHTHITKTEGLKNALDLYKFDVIFGGARRDEEKSRAKERIFSFRSATHHWDPKNQRPELWHLFNTHKHRGESIRVFPLSNWTELDIWQYIYQENIPVVPLYFSKIRPIVERDDMLMMVDDERCQLRPDETIEKRRVRFRTLGCYPLTGAVESDAETLEEIILELVNARNSERQGRMIDSDASASMEKKKQEGYF